jgi:hypothetical protein
MQANTTLKRFAPGQFKVAALAIGIAASVAVGAITYSQTRDTAPAISTSRPVVVKSAEEIRFFELNTQFPEAAPVSIEDWLYQREVAHLNQLAIAEAQQEVAYQRMLQEFYEVNQLVEPAPVVIPNYRLLDMNVLPGDDVPPSGVDRATTIEKLRGGVVPLAQDYSVEWMHFIKENTQLPGGTDHSLSKIDPTDRGAAGNR